MAARRHAAAHGHGHAHTHNGMFVPVRPMGQQPSGSKDGIKKMFLEEKSDLDPKINLLRHKKSIFLPKK